MAPKDDLFLREESQRNDGALLLDKENVTAKTLLGFDYGGICLQ